MRRRSLRSTVVLAGLWVACAAAASAADWPQFHFSASRGGFNPAETVLSAANVHELGVLWTRSFDFATTAPVVAAGRVFFTSTDGNVYALDAKTGATLWWAGASGGFTFGPVVAHGQVLVGGEEGRFFAFPTSCSSPCQPSWSATLTGDRISSPAAVADGAIYVGAGSNLVAVDAGTGSIRWMAPLPAPPNAPAVADGFVYVTSSGQLWAFPVTCSTPCSPVWAGADAGAPPAVAQGVVYADAGFVNRFHAFSAACPEPCLPSWTAFTESAAATAPAVGYGLVYLAQGNGAIEAFPADCATPCTSVWHAVVEVGFGSMTASPALANGVLYAGSGVGSLYMFDAFSGALLARVAVGGFGLLSPAVVDGVVYVSSLSATGRVTALALNPVDVAPVLTVPAGVTAYAVDDSGGAVVFYEVWVSDNLDPSPTVSCDPPSGSTFTLGTSQVTCTARDSAGNTATASFDVTVLPPFDLSLTLDPIVRIDPSTGTGTISGTLSCNYEATTLLSGDVIRWERGAVQSARVGTYFIDVLCTPLTTAWSATVIYFGHRFVPGEGEAFLNGLAFGPVVQVQEFVTSDIQFQMSP